MAASTIAGLALAIFRQCNHLPNRVVHSPEGGYLRGRRASAESARFFWVLEQLLGGGVHIQTAQWSIGEARVAEDSGIRLDGLLYRRPPLRPLVLEYNGCFYHGRQGRESVEKKCSQIPHKCTGCLTCYPNRQMELAGGQTAEQLYARTQQRAWLLEQRHGLAVRQVWGCQWRQILRRSRRLRLLNAQASRNVPGPLDLRRHALFGGRVEPFKLAHVCTPDEEIVVLDIVSTLP